MTVSTDDEAVMSDTIGILKEPHPPFFTIIGIDVSHEPEVSEPFSVTVDVVNTGDHSGTAPVALTIDDLGLEEPLEFELASGETASGTVEDLSIDDPGTYTVEVSSPDEELAESMTVHPDETLDDVDSEDDTDDGQLGFGIVVAVIALMIAGIFATRHRSH